MSVDFKALLSKPTDTIERPLPWPAGTYFGIVKGYELVESKQKKTPGVQYNFTITGAGPDIPQDDLEGIDLSKRAFRTTFWLTPDSEYRLKEFIQSLGIPTAGRTFGELLPECNSQEVVLEITQRNSDDGTEIFNDVNKVKGTAEGS